MAPHTGGGRFVFKNIGRMAAITARLFVLSDEGKVRVLVMVKLNAAPLRADMAAFTTRTKSVLVHVLNPVAAHTCAR